MKSLVVSSVFSLKSVLFYFIIAGLFLIPGGFILSVVFCSM